MTSNSRITACVGVCVRVALKQPYSDVNAFRCFVSLNADVTYVATDPRQ